MVSGIAYGILLQSSFPVDPNGYKLFQFSTQQQGPACYAVAWSPDGKYLATGGLRDVSTNTDIQLFKFDPSQTNPWQRIASLQQGGACFSLSWSPDGKYLVTGGYSQNSTTVPTSAQIQVFAFNPASSNVLNRVAVQNQGQSSSRPLCNAVAWSPDGKYLATGGLAQDGFDMQVFSFDPTQSVPLNRIAGQVQGNQCYALSWSNDGKYLASAGLPQSGATVQVFSFDPTSINTLVLKGTQSAGIACKAVGFSPTGKYLATAGNNLTNGSDVQMFAFDPTQSNVIANKIGVQQQNYCNSLSWSADEKYLVVGSKRQTIPWVNNLQVFIFDPNQSNAIYLQAMQLQGAECFACAWSPDGRYIAGGSNNTSGTPTVQIFNALQFPTGNTIQNNSVIGNATPATKTISGVGIYGSSNANVIVNNSAYKNIRNYVFVTNSVKSTTVNQAAPLLNVEL